MISLNEAIVVASKKLATLIGRIEETVVRQQIGTNLMSTPISRNSIFSESTENFDDHEGEHATRIVEPIIRGGAVVL